MENKRELLEDMFFDIKMVINRHTSPQWSFKESHLTYYNIMLIYDGEGEFIRNNKRYTVQRGDFVFYRLGDSRYISTNPDNLLKCYAVNFMYTVPELKEDYPDDNWVFKKVDLPIDFITKIGDEHVLDRLLYLFDKLFRVHVSNIILRRQEERKIFVDILDLFLFSAYNKDINYMNKVRVENIIKYMTMHFTDNIQIKDLAERENISVSYLVRIFKKITNQTPINYLNSIRMNKARQLLADGCTVTETAELVGFSDVYYFSRVFKQYVGMTPTSYRGAVSER